MDWLGLILWLMKVSAGLAEWRAAAETEETAEARVMARALNDAMAEIGRARAARLAARDAHRRDPAGVMRDDGFPRD